MEGVKTMKRITLFFRLWRRHNLTVALDYWLMRCPVCHREFMRYSHVTRFKGQDA